MIRNVIFDWSGTLVDDLPAVWQATNYVLQQAGLTEMTLDKFRREFSLPFKKFYDRYTPHVPLPQLEEWFHKSFLAAQDSVVELPHAREFLTFCQEQGCRSFVLSSVRMDHYETQAARTGFARFIERPYVQIWDKRDKIAEVLAENRLQPQETLFVGDMQHDIETAKHGGVYSCAVLSGYNHLAQLREAAPDLIVEHLGELQTIWRSRSLDFERHLHFTPANIQPVVTVGALIRNQRGEVLMIRTRKWSNLWGIPGGKTKYGETSESALRREIREETGLEIGDIEFVMAQDCIDSLEFYREAHFLLLNYTCECQGQDMVVLNEEAQEHQWITMDEAFGLALNQPTRRLLEQVARKASHG